MALKVEERTLKRMLVDGRLPVPYLRIGRQVRINEQAFRDWLADQEADSLSSNMAWKEGW